VNTERQNHRRCTASMRESVLSNVQFCTGCDVNYKPRSRITVVTTESRE